MFVIGELLSPKEIDWSLSFSKDDKIPYGCYILQKELKNVNTNDSLISNNQTLYEFFEKTHPLNSNFIFVTYSISLSDVDIDKILKYARIGNNVFISASEFSQNIMDSLEFETGFDFSNPDSIYLKLANPVFKNKKYYYKESFDNNYFSSFDTINTTILGKNNSEKVNFVKIKYGKGNFFINLEPLAFTNINLLTEQNYGYAFNSLSYLSQGTTYWDEYYKPQNYSNETPISVILKNKSLKAAYYLALAGLFLYLIFMGKRRQRIIPVIVPLANTSLEFTEIISHLYLHSRNHKDIALKRYKYLLEFLRSKYNLKINETTSFDIELVSQKTGTGKEFLKKLSDTKNSINSYEKISEEMLFNFNQLIDEFYIHCHK